MSAIQDPEYLNVIMAEFGYDDEDEAEEAPNRTDYIYPSSWKGDSVQLLLERTSTRYGNSMEELKRDGVQALLSHNFSEQRKLRIYNGFRHLGYEIIVENFVWEQINTYPI